MRSLIWLYINIGYKNNIYAVKPDCNYIQKNVQLTETGFLKDTYNTLAAANVFLALGYADIMLKETKAGFDMAGLSFVNLFS
ncbi:MAG: hypothetical protein IKC01_08440 [Clostridia bacterium]|nr:hypothetical protein [Clostridia bacterium]